MVEDLCYPPPIFYVQVRINRGPFASTLADASELMEDCAPPDSTWRTQPVLANDEYLEPLMSKDPGTTTSVLIKALDNGDWEVRHLAVQRLGTLSVDPSITVPACCMPARTLTPR